MRKKHQNIVSGAFFVSFFGAISRRDKQSQDMTRNHEKGTLKSIRTPKLIRNFATHFRKCLANVGCGSAKLEQVRFYVRPCTTFVTVIKK